MIPLLTVRIARDEDVVVARRRARQLAEGMGFDGQDCTRIATAVSEMARNAARYAGEGRVEFAADDARGVLRVRITDRGPGIPHLATVLDGSYQSSTGMGLGILGTRRIVDAFEIAAPPGAGTTVTLEKRLPRSRAPLTARELNLIVARLEPEPVQPALAEIEHQNRELLAAMDEVRERQQELARLNNELQDTNRGVLALYAELDENAEQLRRANQMKSRFLSNMTHEFQTPLNSILALTRLLLERSDGDLSPEQERQVRYIRTATEDLSELVHDLLDLAKVEAGKITIRPATLTVADLFGALRGLMRPIQTQESVALLFDVPETAPPLFTDEAKLSQILRNYISNALKFTVRGEVRVSVAFDDRGLVTFSVADTGIGIADADRQRLFQEFGQLPNALQAKVRGTGLGLSLSKRLAELLGGTVGVHSVLGVGSTFWVRIPIVIPGHETAAGEAAEQPPAPASASPTPPMADGPLALVVDNEPAARYVLRRSLLAAGCRVIEASGGVEGLERATVDRPDVIWLDLGMPDMLGSEVLARLKRQASTAAIPVVIATSQHISDEERQRLSAHAVAVLAKGRLGEADGDADVRRALRAANLAL